MKLKCQACSDPSWKGCCRSSYDELAGVDSLRSFLSRYIFTEESKFSRSRYNCFLSNVAYTLQYIEYLSISLFDHPTQRIHVSPYTISVKQYCMSVFSVIEAYLEWRWLAAGKNPPNSKQELLTQAKTRKYLSEDLISQVESLLELRNKLHLSKILSDSVRGISQNHPIREYDWNSFNYTEYHDAKNILKLFLLELSSLDSKSEDFEALFKYLNFDRNSARAVLA